MADTPRHWVTTKIAERKISVLFKNKLAAAVLQAGSLPKKQRNQRHRKPAAAYQAQSSMSIISMTNVGVCRDNAGKIIIPAGGRPCSGGIVPQN